MKKAIILGSGLDILSGESPLESIPYTEIPGWPLGKVKGHKGVLDKYKNIWVLRGRAHLYEGFTWEQACFPTQYLINQGIEELILTNYFTDYIITIHLQCYLLQLAHLALLDLC
jgi:purine nucleoside phosphorylase